jgi:hypothetical protein
LQIVTGEIERWGLDVIKRIKKQFSNEEHQLVTVDESSDYMGFYKRAFEKLSTPTLFQATIIINLMVRYLYGCIIRTKLPFSNAKVW